MDSVIQTPGTQGRAGVPSSERLRLCVCLLGVVAATLEVQPADPPEYRDESAREYLTSVAGGLRKEISPSPASLLIEARLMSRLGRHDEAERLARQGLDLAPLDVEPRVFISDLLVRQGRFDEAATVLREALRVNDAVPGGYRRLGMVADRIGDREGAQAAFESALERDPDDALSCLLLGQLLLDANQAEAALPHLERACALSPDSANGYYALAQAWMRTGNRESAKRTLKTFQQLKRQEQKAADVANASRDDAREMRGLASGFHVETAVLLAQTGRPERAEAHLRQAMKIAPREIASREMLGALLLRRGRLTAAANVIEGLVGLAPENAGYHANLGTIRLNLRDYPAAVSSLHRALELDPNHVEALNNLARFYLGSRTDLAQALALCRRLVKVQPAAANHDLLAWALFANGQLDAAREASARSVELAPGNPTYAERLRRLNEQR